ncbi:MAG: hypothetical protein AAFY76_10985 [Cyanobacteria bacterium J06649_11]
MDTFPQPSVNVLLNGIYLNHHFDGGTRGNTGEFYWFAIISDGDVVVTTSSKQVGMGGQDGIQSGVKSGSWLAIEDLNIFNTTKRNTTSRSLSVGIRVVESDDSDEAKSVFKNLSIIAASVVTSFTGNPAIGTGTKQVVNLINSFLELDDDDLALGRVLGIHAFQHYKVGKFLSLSGRNGTQAIISVIPVNKRKEEFFFKEKKLKALNYPKGDSTPIFEIKQKGQISCFRRQLTIGSKLELVNAKSRKTVRSSTQTRRRFSPYAIKTFHNIVPGKYFLRVTSPPAILLPGKLKYMFTAYGSSADGLALDPG